MMGKKDKRHEEKVLDVDASMQGTLTFKEPVNLKINGRFEGSLNTKGNLMIGENATVNADIACDSIVVAGKVNGNINAVKEIKIIAPGCVVGEIKTPLLSVAEGAILEGTCSMLSKSRQESRSGQNVMSTDELAKYLEIDTSLVLEWASSGRLPGMRDGNSWRFDRLKVDEWLTTEKIK